MQPGLAVTEGSPWYDRSCRGSMRQARTPGAGVGSRCSVNVRPLFSAPLCLGRRGHGAISRTRSPGPLTPTHLHRSWSQVLLVSLTPSGPSSPLLEQTGQAGGGGQSGLSLYCYLIPKPPLLKPGFL